MFHLQYDTKRTISQSNFFPFYEILGENLTFLSSKDISVSFTLLSSPTYEFSDV